MNDLNHIIFKVIANEASEAEREQVEIWINSDEKNHAEFLKIKSYYASQVVFHHGVDPEAAYRRFRENKLRNTENRRVRRYVIAILSTAAAVALLLLMVRIPGKEPLDNYSFITYDSRDTLYLPDSTRVILNKNSKINYTSGYAVSERRVKLIGEGYFDVRKNTEIPFVVEMEKGQIAVLGTVFNVRTYEADRFIKATLISGSIQFSMPENLDQITLKPDQELRFNKETEEISIKKVDVASSLLWLNEIYRYESTTLQYLLDDLGVINNLQIKIADKNLAKTVISGSFRHDQSLSEILKTISLSVPIQWHINDKDKTVLVTHK